MLLVIPKPYAAEESFRPRTSRMGAYCCSTGTLVPEITSNVLSLLR